MTAPPADTLLALADLEKRWRELHRFAGLLASVPMHARNHRLLAATILDCKAAKAAYEAAHAATRTTETGDG